MQRTPEGKPMKRIGLIVFAVIYWSMAAILGALLALKVRGQI